MFSRRRWLAFSWDHWDCCRWSSTIGELLSLVDLLYQAKTEGESAYSRRAADIETTRNIKIKRPCDLYPLHPTFN